jgi:transposase InsO family protein
MKKLIEVYPQITKTELAAKMGVSRSMLYYHYKRPAVDEEVKHQIESVLVDHSSYGHKRIALHLKLNKKRILRVMKKFGIKPYKRRFKRPIKKDDLGKKPVKFENEIERFCSIRPNVVWVTDFTYIKFQSKFIYLAVIMDLYTREIIGVNISRFHNRELVLGALIDALNKTGTVPKYIHSDQGSEYDSKDFVDFVLSKNVVISMSRKSSPWENGYQESFFSTLKLELGDISRFEMEGELIENIYQIIYYYNNRRIHTKLKTTPVNFRICFNKPLH